MLSAQLEDRFREALGERWSPERHDSIRFATQFAGLLARIVPADSPADAMARMGEAIRARSDLAGDEIDTLIDLAMRPEHRDTIDEDGLRAFGARFGSGAEQALRAAVAEELDLAGFSARYGSAEALLLLDAWFSICAVDGVIDKTEIGQLEQAAKQLGIDAMLVSALFRKHDSRYATGDFQFELSADQYVIGSSSAADIRLPDPLVGRRHCQLLRAGDQWRVVDIDSGRPTLLDGNPITSAPFAHGQTLRVGSYTLELDPTHQILTAYGESSFSALSVRHLKRRIGKTALLDDVSFTCFSGEVIAVVGPSGAGKTTLLNAIAGIAPPNSGDVILDGQNFHALLNADRSLIGNVPQDDVVHAELTVEEALRYAAQIRFPAGTARRAINHEVERVLDELDIAHIRKSRIGSQVRRGISGGQRKRVNLGQELLTRSTRVLFLDEPTSGLDPQTAADIVGLIRSLADGGRIVFLVTHDVNPTIMGLIDHLMVLAPGGRLAWFGPPTEGCQYFGVHSPDEIFGRLTERTPEDWGQLYRDSQASRKYVRTREHLLGLDGVEVASADPRNRRKKSWLSQYFTLSRRYARVKLRDWSGMFVLLAQAPILGVAMWIVFPAADINSCFMLALSTLWFGASASVRELIAERPIWRRESRVGLRSGPYMASKITVLGLIVGLQCFLLATMNFVMLGMWGLGFSWLQLTFVSVLTGWVGMSLGLLMSALFSSSEAAVGTLPLLLIPQITFGGLIVKVKEMGLFAKAISYVMIVRYSFDAIIKTGDRLTVPARRGMDRDLDGQSIGGSLWELGFRTTSNADDMGFPLVILCCLLFAFFLFFMTWTWIFTARSSEGN
ncbi:MAG: ATP-binding cassette domain-containing protein [Alphaproteobacteria bacterium]|nr:ATP-binding cassette domain-containing protein [Alphaproteobacteria bacterium]